MRAVRKFSRWAEFRHCHSECVSEIDIHFGAGDIWRSERRTMIESGTKKTAEEKING